VPLDWVVDVATPPSSSVGPSSFGEEEWAIGTAWQFESKTGSVTVSAPDRESPLYEGQLLLDHHHQWAQSSSSSSSTDGGLSQPFKAVSSSDGSGGGGGGQAQTTAALSMPGQALRLLECCDEAHRDPASRVLFATALREGLLHVNWHAEWQHLDTSDDDGGGAGNGVVVGVGKWLSLRTNQLLCEARNGQMELVEASDDNTHFSCCNLL